LEQYEETIEPGFVSRDRQELSQRSLDFQLPRAALRRAERGLRIDPERTELKELRETALNRAQPVADQRVEEELAFLSHILAQEITDPRIKLTELTKKFNRCGVLEVIAPLT
jgi:hypothetical protein